MKLCQKCKEEPITVKLTEVVNGEKTELLLCESCAQQRGVTINKKKPSLNLDLDLDISEPLKLEDPTEIPSLPKTLEDVDATCPKCGLDFEEFRSQSLFGCSHDYVVFEDQIREIIEKIHGNAKHKGKVPSRLAPDIAIERQIIQLKGKLQRAIDREEYEKAAEIRDRIIAIEGEEDGSR